MANPQPIRIKTISEFHKFMQLPGPEHPLVSVVRFEDVKREYDEPVSRIMDFYSIAIKRNFNVKMRYGQQTYDFDDGIMFCMSPGQLLRIEFDKTQQRKHTGWNLLIHPDFLWNSPLAKTIKKYQYFDYSVNEALFLSPKEEEMLIGILQQIDQESRANVDKFAQDIIIGQIELLLRYTDRFYHRQFLTRKIVNHQILDRVETLLTDYIDGDRSAKEGVPTVTWLAQNVNLSPGYLSELLRSLTGLNTQQLIHEKLIQKAKEKLTTTDLSVREIAWELGFEFPQSFSKLFKAKTELSPLQFRQSFT